MFARTQSRTREGKDDGNSSTATAGGRTVDKRDLGVLLVELTVSVVGYYILYQSMVGLINMMDPTKKDKRSVAKVREAGVGVWGLVAWCEWTWTPCGGRNVFMRLAPPSPPPHRECFPCSRFSCA